MLSGFQTDMLGVLSWGLLEVWGISMPLSTERVRRRVEKIDGESWNEYSMKCTRVYSFHLEGEIKS